MCVSCALYHLASGSGVNLAESASFFSCAKKRPTKSPYRGDHVLITPYPTEPRVLQFAFLRYWIAWDLHTGAVLQSRFGLQVVVDRVCFDT